MQESMQGKVNSDIFNNNSYQCKVLTNNKSSIMSASFSKGHFKVSHLGDKKIVEVIWYGEYKFLKVGQVIFRTKEFRMTDQYGVKKKHDGDILFNVKGNASQFELKSPKFKYSCKRIRF